MTMEERGQARDRKIWGGILAGMIGRGVGLVAPFLVMPAMLNHLGQVDFGIWMTAVSITSMAMFIDFGIGNGLLTKLSKAYGEQDFATMRRLIATSYATLTLIAIAAAIILILLLVGLTWQGYSNLWGFASTEGRWIVIVTGTSFLLGIPISVIQRVMLACQKNVSINAWQIVGSIAAVAGCYGAIYAKLPASFAVAAYSMSPIGAMLLATSCYFKKNPKLHPHPRDLSLANARSLMALGSYFFALSILTSIALNADNAIIAFILGAEAVTEYAIPTKLASVLALLVTTIFLPLWAANGEALQRRDYSWIKQNTKKMMFFGIIVLGIAGSVISLSGDTLIHLWMGRSFTSTTETLAAFSFLYILLAISAPYQMLLNSAGIIKVQIIAWIAYLIVSASAKTLALMAINQTWIVPLVSAVAFLICVLPIIALTARKIYQDA